MGLEIAIGPLLFHWPEAMAADFYARIAEETDVDRVYLGEIVCSKRLPFIGPALRRAAERLERAGKQVVWSGLALPGTGRERRIAGAHAKDERLVEINDLTSLAGRPSGAPFVAGPLLNIYNERAAEVLIAKGCVRLCANVELSLAAAAAISRNCPALELEIFAFGRIPLAMSARCYHARRHGLHKDGCLFLCGGDPDGMEASTVEGQPFLVVNGVQTMSYGYQCIDAPRDSLLEAGVTALRLSPHTGDMVSLANAYRGFANGSIERAELRRAAAVVAGKADLINGYVHGRAGAAWVAS